jgi:hypothetical protein
MSNRGVNWGRPLTGDHRIALKKSVIWPNERQHHWPGSAMRLLFTLIVIALFSWTLLMLLYKKGLHPYPPKFPHLGEIKSPLCVIVIVLMICFTTG